jgi:hypothetical protein
LLTSFRYFILTLQCIATIASPGAFWKGKEYSTMFRFITVFGILWVGLNFGSRPAHAQWFYPGGYGGYGMSRWGADPAAGYMAGLGAYARGQGVYELDKAKADAINVDTMIKWNKALRARQLALREEARKEAISRDAERKARAEQIELRDGTTLNSLLGQILDTDPAAARSARARISLSPSAIREIPFEWDSEAITICIDQMSATAELPGPLAEPRFAEERNALHAAVTRALEEDAKGSVSPSTTKRISDAVAAYRSRFLKTTSDFQNGYHDSLDYFTTMAGLSRLLNDPSFKAFMAKLEDGDERTVGDLVAFMTVHNLRFGAASTDRQDEIYTRLVPALIAIRDESTATRIAPPVPDRSGQDLRAAAKHAFKGMGWSELEAHRKSQ